MFLISWFHQIKPEATEHYSTVIAENLLIQWQEYLGFPEKLLGLLSRSKEMVIDW